jgi:dTDP-4-amino-4,6-dideoxygalactose transaminase
MAGSIGELGCFSFYPTKNLSAAGDAGLVVTNNDTLAHNLRALRSHGEFKKYEHSAIGLNSRLSALNAVTLLIKMKYIESWNKSRIKLAELYSSEFIRRGLTDGCLKIPVTIPGATHIYHQYSIRCQERDKLATFLRKHGIGTTVHYPDVIYRQPVFSGIMMISPALSPKRHAKPFFPCPCLPS